MSTLVRYVTSSNGARVRDNPASSNIVVTLQSGELMYDHVGISKVTAALNGTNHVWIKVHYYHINGDNSTSEGDGWIAEDVVAFVPTALPAKSAINSSNISQQNKRLQHARYIYNYLYSCGWSPNAIYAALGNFEIESYLDPNSRSISNDTFGIAHWHPADKISSTLHAGETAGDIDVQLRKLNDDRTNHSGQWITRSVETGVPGLSFEEYVHSTKSISILTKYFMYCYEVCFDNTLSKRQSSANKWWNLISKIY